MRLLSILILEAGWLLVAMPEAQSTEPVGVSKLEWRMGSGGLGFDDRFVGDIGEWAQQRLGMKIAVSYDALALGGLNDADEWGAASGDVNLSVRWQLREQPWGAPMMLGFRIRDRHGFGGTAPTDLRTETGALWGYADGFTRKGTEVPEVYLEDQFFSERLTVRYGKMMPDDWLDDHQLRSGKRAFLNQAFSSSPAVGFPGAALGMAVRWVSPRGWDLSAVFSNLESSNIDEEVDWGLNTDTLFSALQVGKNGKGWRGLPARVQGLLWHGDGLPDEGASASQGVSLTVEQGLSERCHLFLRYAWSDGDLAPVRKFTAAGLGWRTGRDHLVGVACAWGEAGRPDENHQSSLEAFYRYPVGEDMVITPDLQINFGDQLASGRGWLLLAGLRVGFAF